MTDKDKLVPRHFEIGELLRKQSHWCQRLNSPLYAYLLEQSALDFELCGPVQSVLAGHESDQPESALALRFMGAVHRIVLIGGAPKLAKYYPSVGGKAEPRRAWPEFRKLVAERREVLRPLIERPVQTNEVGRCAALLPGFLEAARQTGMPLRLLELGTSAGLNLRWDRYRYEYSNGAWGPLNSKVLIRDVRSEGDLPLDVFPKVASRSGCDIRPVDPTTGEGKLTLMSYTWADHYERLQLLRNALPVAQSVPCNVQASGVTTWLNRQLSIRTKGVCTAVFHSIVWQYLQPTERDQVCAAIQHSSESACSDTALAWLRMEPGADQTEVKLQIWPDGEDKVIATAGYHGAGVRWLN